MDLAKLKYVIVVVLAYSFLSLLYISMEPEAKERCSFESSCIQVCCQEKENCNENVVREAFQYVIEEENDTKNWEYEVVNGRPRCALLTSEIKKTNSNWTFDHHGSVRIAEEDGKVLSFNHDEYCFEEINIDENSWKLLTCKPNESMNPNIIKYLTLIISLLLIGATGFVHAFFVELRMTLNGKFILVLMISLFVYFLALAVARTTFSSSFGEEEFYVMVCGLFTSFTWLTVMSFDVFWTFEYFTSSSDSQKRFKLYCIGTTFSVMVLMISCYEFSKRQKLFEDILFITLLFNGALVSAAAFKRFKVSKNVNIDETSRFKEQSDRLWTFVTLLAIMTVTWTLELRSWRTSGPHVSVFEIIKCLSAVVIFTLLVLNEKVRGIVGLSVPSNSNNHQELTFDVKFDKTEDDA